MPSKDYFLLAQHFSCFHTTLNIQYQKQIGQKQISTCSNDSFSPIHIRRLSYDKTIETLENEPATLVVYMELANRNLEIHQEYLVYDWNNFFSELGGLVGLLLGYSMLTFYDQVKGIILHILSKLKTTK